MKSKENHGLKETNMDEGSTILGNSLLNTNLGLLKVMFYIFLGNQPGLGIYTESVWVLKDDLIWEGPNFVGQSLPLSYEPILS